VDARIVGIESDLLLNYFLHSQVQIVTLNLNFLSALVMLLSASSCAQNPIKPIPMMKKNTTSSPTTPNELAATYDTATFGAGCFWCVEAQFQLLKGVIKVESGYSGGSVANPSYKEVCTGRTGHAEVCTILYDSSTLSYEELLYAFWQSHDPTQLNRQGNDIGTQYRSVIFYHTEKQKQLAEQYKKKLNDEKVYDTPIVTEISPFGIFYTAEEYHQNYFNQNGNEPYCQLVVRTKVEKFKKVFRGRLKTK
jgi:peptide-methionine (S)-S-oxide reductase